MTDPSADSSDEAHEQLVRLGAFLRRTLRFWRTPLILGLLGAAAGAVFLFFVRKPSYRSETVILYSEGVRPADDTDRPETARSVTVRLKEILMSRSSLDSIVREFDLYPDVRRTRGPVDAVEELRKHVEFRAPGGDTFSIAFVGATPKESERVTARLAEVVIAQDSDLRKKQALVARDFLETEKAATESHLREAEQALAAFMGVHPRFALDATPLATGAAIRASMGAPAIGTLPASGAVRPRPMPSSPQDRAAGSGAPSATNPEVGDERAAAAEEARAGAALAAASANLADLTAHFTPAHPDVRAAQTEVDRAKARLAAATAAVAAAPKATRVATAPTPVAAAPEPRPFVSPPPVHQTPVVTPVGTQPTAAPGAAAGAKPVERDVVALETDWVKLTRGVTEARQHQDQVEGALFKANIAVSSESGGHGVQVTVIDPAFVPESPMPPGRAIILAMFVGIALLLGVVVSFCRAFLDDRVYGSRDVARFSEVLAEVPRVSSRRAHVPS